MGMNHKGLTIAFSMLLGAAALLAFRSSRVEQQQPKGDPALTLSADSVIVDVGASASVSATVSFGW